MLEPKRYVPAYRKGMVGAVIVMALAVCIIVRDGSGREDLERSSGRVTYIGDLAPDGSRPRDPGKRYLVVDDKPPVFLLRYARHKDDLLADGARLDSLHIGDLVDVYYDDLVARDGFCYLLFFIDQGNRPFYHVASRRGLGWVVFALGAILMGVMLYLERRPGR